MSVYKILHYPHVLLRKKSTPVTTFDADLKTFVEGMVETMYAHQGIGLAAVQVGVLRRILVVDVKPYLENPDLTDWHGSIEMEREGESIPLEWPLRLINPEITERVEEVHFPFDGCLSLPGVSLTDTRRDKRITLQARDVEGRAITIRCEGILSICLQHEMDHLEGVLFIDRLMVDSDDSLIRDEIHTYEEDPSTRKSEKKLKPIDARKLKLSFVNS